MNVPAWMTPPGITDVRRAQVEKDWRERDRRKPISDEARQAIIEHARNLKAQREFARVNRERIDAEWDALEAPPLTIAQHIDHARKLRLANTPRND